VDVSSAVVASVSMLDGAIKDASANEDSRDEKEVSPTNGVALDGGSAGSGTSSAVVRSLPEGALMRAWILWTFSWLI